MSSSRPSSTRLHALAAVAASSAAESVVASPSRSRKRARSASEAPSPGASSPGSPSARRYRRMHPAPPRQCGVPKLAGSPTLPLPKLRTASRTCSQCSKKFVAPTGKSKTLFHGHTLFCTARCHTAWANAHNVEGVVKTVRRKSPPLAAASSSAAAHTAYLALSAELARSRDRAVEIAKAQRRVGIAAGAAVDDAGRHHRRWKGYHRAAG